jgi:NAD(P)-dependent dehydrogenase (short-subunit alcohol dehydrogenase family)
MEKGLIVGGNSGIGENTFNILDKVAGYVDWHRPDADTMDVREEYGIHQYVHDHGPFDAIVYSAGVNNLEYVGSLTDGSLMETFAVNVFGFILIMAAHEEIYPEAEGSAVVVTSDAARTPMRCSTAYCSSKAALEMAIKTMARELAPRWRINGVAPGMVADTPMTDYIDATVPIIRGWTPEQALAYERRNVPTGRRATKDEVSETIRWALFGPPQMTGAIIDVNGGR